MLTESRNPRTAGIDTLPTLEVLRLINDEDATVAGAVCRALPQIAEAVDAIVESLGGGGRLFYAGAGTSGRLAVLDAVELVPTYSAPSGLVVPLIAGGAEALTRSVEGVEDRTDLGRADLLGAGVQSGDVLVGLAASGATPYVLGAIEAAREAGAVTVGVSCNAPAPLLAGGGYRHRPIGGPGGGGRLHADEVGHGPEADAQYAQHRCHDPAGQGVRRPDGGRASEERQAGAARPRHGDGDHRAGRSDGSGTAGPGGQ